MRDALATRDPLRLVPDASRVVAQLFVPGQSLSGERKGREWGVLAHVLGLDDDEVAMALDVLAERFGRRHLDLTMTFARHADHIIHRLGPDVHLSDERRLLLLGATFTHEYSVEAAALCNPSVVTSPDQTGLAPGQMRFVMSVRQIGEGHRSSIGFRSGVVDRDGSVAVQTPGPFTTTGRVERDLLHAATFRNASRNGDMASTAWVLDGLGPHFSDAELTARLIDLESQQHALRDARETAQTLRDLAARTYQVRFPETARLDERVLVPSAGVESNGMEDARFVRFVDDDGSTSYYATYTAYDGRRISQQFLATEDFQSFSASPLTGAGAANKGVALFPRRIGGRYFAVTRHDGETNAVASSDDIRSWPTPHMLDLVPRAWEAVQVGNCGPPIETAEGWLVLTHGVGAMRTYSIGALLLDLDDPTTVIGRLTQPLLTPQPDEQDGYVPNVVYSCGALAHGERLLVPYGIGDANIGFATFVIDDVLAAMHERPMDERPATTATNLRPTTEAAHMPDTAAPPHEHHDQFEVADRRCWRCLQMFPGDATQVPTAHAEWWVCDPCDASLFPGKRATA